MAKTLNPKPSMKNEKKIRPSVPSSWKAPSQGSGWNGNTAEGAKNPWVRTGCQIKLNIATYNIQTMSTEDRLEELITELEKVKCDILGISEVRRKGVECIKLNSGQMLFYSGNEDRAIGGVGILINKKYSNKVIKYRAISDRVLFITIRINQKTAIKIVQTYAPTSTHEDEEVERFYEDIEKSIKDGEDKVKYTLIMGDFNAKIGKNRNENEEFTGNFGLGTRNERGDRLINFQEQHKIYNMNSFFKKKPKRRWTWTSPNGQYKNEIDYILSTNKHIVHDVSVLNALTGSDHRIVRAKIVICDRLERYRKIMKKQMKLNIDTQKLQVNTQRYQTNLVEELNKAKISNEDEINNTYKKITTAIKEAATKNGRKEKKSHRKLSRPTIELLEKRRILINEGKRGTVEYVEINKLVRRRAKEDIRMHTQQIIENVIEENKGTKIWKNKLRTGHKEIITLKNEEGREITDRNELLKIAEKYYEKLYETKVDNTVITNEINKKLVNVHSEELPDINEDEIKKAITKLANGRSPGSDEIIAEMIKQGGDVLVKKLKILFNMCLGRNEIPKEWDDAIIILIYKKGDKADLNNYRPISLLSQIYKLFTSILTSRLEKKLDFYQPKEQAGFRKGFGTTDHLQTMRLLIEKTTEYKMPIWLAFVDYQKAFDSIETWAILKSLKNARIDYRYTDIIETIYKRATLKIKLHEYTDPVKIKRGVRQGDPISPKLFTLAMEDIFKTLNWENKGILINGERLNNLRYADDIVLITDNFIDLQEMVQELAEASQKIGLHMNINKTKVMTNNQEDRRDIIINEKVIERVDKYVYLGHEMKVGKENQEAEVKRRVTAGWSAFGKLNQVWKTKIPSELKAKVFNQCVIPAMTYGTETWVLTKAIMNRMRVAQRAMERKMVGVTLADRKTNEWLRERSKVEDIATRIARQKWEWAGHVARMPDKWSKKILEWRPWGRRRGVGRPMMRWADEIRKTAGTKWQEIAKNRKEWKGRKEAYIRIWIERG